MAHTKAGGSTKLGRDSHAKRLGIKIHDGEPVRRGQIIIRQRGTKYHPGRNVLTGADDTIFANIDGVVRFYLKSKSHFDGTKRHATFVDVRTA